MLILSVDRDIPYFCAFPAQAGPGTFPIGLHNRNIGAVPGVSKDIISKLILKTQPN
jgi:hypothetical protein